MEESSEKEFNFSLGIKFSDRYKHPRINLSEDRKSASIPNARRRERGTQLGDYNYMGICGDNVMSGKGKYKIKYNLTSLSSNWMMYGIIEEGNKESVFLKNYNPYNILAKTIYGWGGVGFVYNDGKKEENACILRKPGGIYELTLDLINDKIFIESPNQKPYSYTFEKYYKGPKDGKFRLEREIPSGKDWRFIVVLEYATDSVTILGDEVREYFKPKNVELGKLDEKERVHFILGQIDEEESENGCFTADSLIVFSTKSWKTKFFKWLFL